MNKTELIEHIAKHADISKAAATRAFEKQQKVIASQVDYIARNLAGVHVILDAGHGGTDPEQFRDEQVLDRAAAPAPILSDVFIATIPFFSSCPAQPQRVGDDRYRAHAHRDRAERVGVLGRTHVDRVGAGEHGIDDGDGR